MRSRVGGALLFLLLAWTAREIQTGLGAPGPTPPVEGGPFESVIYRVSSHSATAVPGVFREGTLTFRAQAIQYNDLTHIARSIGASTITDGSATATARQAAADFDRHTVTLNGSVHFIVLARNDQGRPVHINLACPVVDYSTVTGVVRCSGGVSGQIAGLAGVQTLPGTGAAAAGGPVGVQAAGLVCDPRARMLEGTGGILLVRGGDTARSGDLTLDLQQRILRLGGGITYQNASGGQVTGASAAYDLRRHSLTAVGPIHFADRSGSSGQAASAILEDNVLQLAGPVTYTEKTGRTLRGARATDDLQRHTILLAGPVNYADRDGGQAVAQSASLDQQRQILTLAGPIRYMDKEGRRVDSPRATIEIPRDFISVAGPVRYGDRKGNTMVADSATLDRRAQIAWFRGNVRFSDKQGTQGSTPWATAHLGKNGADTLQTGPIRFRGMTSSP